MDSYAYSYSCPGSRGDLVVFRRPGGYDHYAINVGNGYIVHVTTPDDIASTSFNAARSSIGFCCSTNSLGPTAVVKKEPFANFVKPGDNVTVEDGTWNGKTALQRVEIVSRALSKIGEEGYNLFFKNCEHFARWCRYGEEKSDQATNLGIGLGVAGAAVFLGVLGYGAYRFLSDSEAEKEKKRKYRR